MKKTLQDQYLLIKEGKGHKDVFIKEAKRQFPGLIRNSATYTEVANVLKTKNLINENIIGLEPINQLQPSKKESFEVAFENFLAEAKKAKENDEKAELKKPSKQVEEDAEKNFDYEDKKNPDNLIFDQIMKGYYTEMKDPKNEDKTMEQLKAIVIKNLEKNPTYYTEKGQFGVKDLGYTMDAPGLGEPKEPKGPHKSSGYGNLNEGIESHSFKVGDKVRFDGSIATIINIGGGYAQLDWNDEFIDISLKRLKPIQEPINEGILSKIKDKFLDKISSLPVFNKLTDTIVNKMSPQDIETFKSKISKLNENKGIPSFDSIMKVVSTELNETPINESESDEDYKKRWKEWEKENGMPPYEEINVILDKVNNLVSFGPEREEREKAEKELNKIKAIIAKRNSLQKQEKEEMKTLPQKISRVVKNVTGLNLLGGYGIPLSGAITIALGMGILAFPIIAVSNLFASFIIHSIARKIEGYEGSELMGIEESKKSLNEAAFKYDSGDYEEVETLFTKITGRPATDLDNNMFSRGGGSADGDGEGWMLNIDDTNIPASDKTKFVDAVMDLGKQRGWKIKQYGDDAVEIYEKDPLNEETQIRKVVRSIINEELEEGYDDGEMGTHQRTSGTSTRHRKNPQDMETYLNAIKGMKKVEAIEYLGEEGLSSSMVMRVLNKADQMGMFDVQDMFDVNPTIRGDVFEFKKNDTVMYMGEKHKVDFIDGSIIKLERGNGDIVTLNKSQADEKIRYQKDFSESLNESKIRKVIRESVEKELQEINKLAEYEVFESKLEKIAELIEKKSARLNRLDEDEDLKALTDKKKVKELQRDIKKLEKAKAKLEKALAKKAKATPKKKEVIDEDEPLSEAPGDSDDAKNMADDLERGAEAAAQIKDDLLDEDMEAPADYLEAKEDAEGRYDAGEELDSILSDYPKHRDMLERDILGKFDGMDY